LEPNEICALDLITLRNFQGAVQGEKVSDTHDDQWDAKLFDVLLIESAGVKMRDGDHAARWVLGQYLLSCPAALVAGRRYFEQDVPVGSL
jgi:hypothetical protein